MPRLPFFDHVSVSRRERLAVKRRFASVTAQAELLGETRFGPDQFVWSFSASIGVMMTGTDSDMVDMQRVADRMIAKEIFGPLEDDMIEMLRLIWAGDRDNLRRASILGEAMLTKMRAESASVAPVEG